MEFRYHPIIEDLKINEDGSEIYLQGKLIHTNISNRERAFPNAKANFNGKSYSVSKLICEAWHGLRPNIAQFASRVDLKKGFHYSNLEWRESPNTGIERFRQKLSPEDIEDIIQRLKNGDTTKEIAIDYDVTPAKIRLIRSNDQKNQQSLQRK